MVERLANTSNCPQCGSQISALALVCPNCQRLVHADALQQISADATAAAERDDRSEELRLWRSALELLPRDSRQYTAIEQRVIELSRIVDAAAPRKEAHHAPAWMKTLGPLTPILLLLWKFRL